MDVMSKKIFVVTCLNGKNPYREIDELIIPDSIVYVDGSIAGFAVPLINNHRNLGALINDRDCPLEKKLGYLVQMGEIIDKVERVDNFKYKFQFGDLNEFNFIIDNDDRVLAIDLDSSYLGLGEPLEMAYYLLKNQYIKSLPDKYKTTSSGIVIPSDNTDLYCYNMIILNAIAGENIYKYDIESYYKYLDYIKTLGVPDELLDAFNNIYIPKSNINPKDALRDINCDLEEQLSYKTFKKEYLKN
jgi:hypothetical protein